MEGMALEPAFRKQIDEALTWMPADTQSISFTSLSEDVLGQEDLSVLSPNFGLWQVNYLRPLLRLADFEKGAGSPYCCIHGVAARGGGGGGNPSCHFLFLKPGPAFHENWRKLSAEASAQYTDAGTTVLEFKPAGKPDAEAPAPPAYRLCNPAPGLVAGATDRELLHEILERMRAPAPARAALPETLEEWQSLDTGAHFWGLRHFAASDTTSPAHAGGRHCLDRQARGMAFSFDPLSRRAAFTYHSANPDIDRIAKAISDFEPVEKDKGSVSFHRGKKGVFTIAVADATGDFPHGLWNALAIWMGDHMPTQAEVQGCLDRLPGSR